MKLKNIDAHRMLGALRSIEQGEGTKLPGQLRLDIARNINRLLPDMQAYEKALMAKRREIQGDANLPANAAILAELDELGQGEIDVKMHKVAHADFRLDDNPRITGDMIAAIAPILKDFDTLDGD